MYPGALLRTPIQTVDSSQVFESWILQNQPNLVNEMTKSWDKNTTKDLEQVCLKQAHNFSFDYCRQKKFFENEVICLIIHLSCRLNFSIKNFEKRLKHFENFKFVDTDSTIHNTNFIFLNDALSSYQNLRFAQWSMILCVDA